MRQTLYDVIRVSPTASLQEVEAACLKLGKKYRPDLNPGDANAAAMFALFEQAFETLTNPGKRALYDESLRLNVHALVATAHIKESITSNTVNSSAPLGARHSANSPQKDQGGYGWKFAGLGGFLIVVAFLAYVMNVLTPTKEHLKIPVSARPDPINPACAASAKELRAFHTRWDDAVQLAGSTQRIALSSRIADLQSIRQSVENIPVLACAVKAQMLLSNFMEKKIESHLAFLRNELIPSQAESDELLWEYRLELKGIEQGCNETCKQEFRLERQLQKEQRAIAEEKSRIEMARLNEERTINYLLDRVRETLHNPSTAKFESLRRNKNNNSVCGSLVALNGAGREVRETFAVKSGGELTIGFTYVGTGSNSRGVNVGKIAAERLCPPEQSSSLARN